MYHYVTYNSKIIMVAILNAILNFS